MMQKILLVEDDMLLAEVLKDFFEENQLKVLHAVDGEEAITLYEREHPHVILLDIILPKKNGFEVIAEIRERDYLIPIILMTGTEMKPESEIKGYKLGAVNYLKKPVLPDVVLAQVENLLHPSNGTENYTIGDYLITIQSQFVKINETSIHQLRERDVQVLSILLKNLGAVIPRQYILQAVWQDDGYNRNNALDSAISRIRKGFRPYPDIIIEPIYAEGYILRQRNSKKP